MFELNQVFGRINEEGNVDILEIEEGYHVNRLNANVFPVDSETGARYDHPEGITLTLEDAKKLGIEIE
ncbi:hypothetical protein [Salmonella enterica]|uniref:hypothetical protein n=1 Tax=Salmonella enterica TaxID=28901 RepID=UPI00217D2A89|nr:hypothetical protein [Salmonella enterica]